MYAALLGFNIGHVFITAPQHAVIIAIRDLYQGKAPTSTPSADVFDSALVDVSSAFLSSSWSVLYHPHVWHMLLWAVGVMTLIRQFIPEGSRDWTFKLATGCLCSTVSASATFFFGAVTMCLFSFCSSAAHIFWNQPGRWAKLLLLFKGDMSPADFQSSEWMTAMFPIALKGAAQVASAAKIPFVGEGLDLVANLVSAEPEPLTIRA